MGEGGKGEVRLTIWEGIVWRQRQPTNLRIIECHVESPWTQKIRHDHGLVQRYEEGAICTACILQFQEARTRFLQGGRQRKNLKSSLYSEHQQVRKSNGFRTQSTQFPPQHTLARCVLLVSRDVCSRSDHTCVFSMTLDARCTWWCRGPVCVEL